MEGGRIGMEAWTYTTQPKVWMESYEQQVEALQAAAARRLLLPLLLP